MNNSIYQQQIKGILEKLNQLEIIPDQTIGLEKVREIESQLDRKLPQSYILYLTQIQNGGTVSELHVKGPYYGINSLEQSLADNIEWGVDVSKPFQFTKDFEFEDVCELPQEHEEHILKMENDQAYKAAIEKYQDNSILNGTLPICAYGCGDYFRLVVNGERSGEVWADCGIVNLTGYYSLNVDILTFYENWLDRQLLIQTDPTKKHINARYPFLEFGNNKKYKVVD